MKRLFTGLLVPLFLLGMGVAGATSSSGSMSSAKTSHHSSTKKSCPAGEHYVKGYTTKDGKHVKGYCRK